nr:molybdopterin-guanine dinucleotide biosynthesis protein MobC [Salmonella enterica]
MAGHGVTPENRIFCRVNQDVLQSAPGLGRFQRETKFMAAQKWFTKEEVEMAKLALSELPDLTEKRLTKSDVLESLREQIIELAEKKGYSADDIKISLDAAGIVTSVKSIREIMSSRKTGQRKSQKVRKLPTPPESTGNEKSA